MIRALEAGADDYITKPFSIRELMARMSAISRRLRVGQPSSSAVPLKVEDLELDLDRRILRRAGTEVHLSPTEFSLLSYLMQHANTAIEHGKLLRASGALSMAANWSTCEHISSAFEERSRMTPSTPNIWLPSPGSDTGSAILRQP
jgi:DNA-binding response OmpR family regulator